MSAKRFGFRPAAGCRLRRAASVFLWLAAAAAAAGGAEAACPGPGAAPPLPEVLGPEVLGPRVLGPDDAVRYRTIFALQQKGRWSEADAEIGGLEDRLLMGHVLGQRYLHPKLYRSKYAELRDWLDEYADHPEAARIYRLAIRRKPAKARAPRRYVSGYLHGVGSDPGAAPPRTYRSTKRLGDEDRRRAQRIKARIHARVRRGWPTGALEVLEQEESRRLLDTVEYDQALAEIAAGYFAYSKDKKALAAAAAAAKRSGRHVPLAHWTAGLTLWRMGRIDEAAPHFEALARSRAASAWDAAAGAYWAARVHLVSGRPREVAPWLKVAAGHDRTFYGLLALRALGMESRFEWTLPALDDDAWRELTGIPGVRRALALLEVGQRHRAETELRKLYAIADRRLADAVLALAVRANLPGLAMRIGAKMAQAEGRHLDSALYPVPAWEPVDGFEIDRALVYAVMRQESRFNASARSPAGARGLMQLMPHTARFIADGKSYRGELPDGLFDPEINIALGQRYLNHLLDNEMVQGNLFLLAAAYNGGPGKLAKWQRKVDYRDDPLLFIESIPSRETRIFIERILANLWIYRQRLGQPTPSLEAIASGDWPSYQPLDRPELVPAGRADGP